jgi:hypothetical protein
MRRVTATSWHGRTDLLRRIALAALFVVVAVIIGTREIGSTRQMPHISTLVPSHAQQGSNDLVVHVTGEHFQPGASVVLWNGSARPTQTFQGSTTVLAATIFSRDLFVPGPATVTVTIVDADIRRSTAPVIFDVIPKPGPGGADTAAYQRTASDRAAGPTGNR